MIVSPPSWRMATSNDTRVRVDGLSKIIASTLPSNGRLSSPAFRRDLRALASSRISLRSVAETVERSTKWRTELPMARRPSLGCGGGDGRRRQALDAVMDAFEAETDFVFRDD